MTDFFIYLVFLYIFILGIWSAFFITLLTNISGCYPIQQVNGCEHVDLEEHKYREYKEYIQKGSLTHETLRSIIMDERLLYKIPYFLNCWYAVSYCISAQFK